MAGRGGEDGAPDLEAYVAAPVTLSEHLTRQAMIALKEPADRMIASALIDALDEAGYLTGALEEIAERLGAPLSHVEEILRAPADAWSRPASSRAASPNVWRCN